MAEETWTDDRARQDSLIDDPDVVSRPEQDSRIDRGSSDELVDDRTTDDDSDAGKQASLAPETVDDGNQQDLTGETAGEPPAWE